MSKPYYYSLITAEIQFNLPGDPTVHAGRLNGVMADALPEITAKLIGKAQQIVQLQFHKRMEGLDPKVLDVVLLGLTPLGRMTESEFQGTPKGEPVSDKVLPQPKHLNQDDPFSSI
jgi:hypothetical protein